MTCPSSLFVPQAWPCNRPIRRARAGISLAEVLVIVAIVAILFSIFVPYVGKIRELDRRSRCANNLRALQGALRMYASTFSVESKLIYPATAFDASSWPHYVAFTGADEDPTAGRSTVATSMPTTMATSSSPPAIAPPLPVGPSSPTSQPTLATSQPVRPTFLPGAVQPNDVTASLWLLVRLGLADPATFICPSGDETPDPMLTRGTVLAGGQRSNFTSGKHLSYSYAYPFPRLSPDVLPSDFPILSDKNPGAPEGGDPAIPPFNADPLVVAKMNSPNHARAGQNVLYASGLVEFRTTPYCGYGVPPTDPKTIYRDNLFTAYPGSPLPPGTIPKDIQVPGVCRPTAGPTWVYDSYLVPTAKD